MWRGEAFEWGKTGSMKERSGERCSDGRVTPSIAKSTETTTARVAKSSASYVIEYVVIIDLLLEGCNAIRL
jgi:hypothetical protein